MRGLNIGKSMVRVHLSQVQWTGRSFSDRRLGTVVVTRAGLQVRGASPDDETWIESMVDAVRPPSLLRLLSPRAWADRLAARLDRPQIGAHVEVTQAREGGRADGDGFAV